MGSERNVGIMEDWNAGELNSRYSILDAGRSE
jgi:hypothetical protein